MNVNTSRRRTVFSMLGVSLALLLTAGLATTTRATEPQPQAGPYGYAFTYQGELRDDGVPINGQCDLWFDLWDAPAGGKWIGMLDMPGVTLVDGKFTARLDFGPAAHTGGARWLEVRVRCPTGSGHLYDTLSPRQELTAAPAAMALVLPFQATASTTLPVISIENTGSDGIGVEGRGPIGIYGLSTSAAKVPGIGVEGQADSWIAVFGLNTSTEATVEHVGVAGESHSSKGYAVQGWSAASHGGVGVRGLADGADAVGVQGVANGANASGVKGEANGMYAWGVQGIANGSDCAATYNLLTCNGVSGTSSQGNGIAGSTSIGAAIYGYVSGYTGEGLVIASAGNGDLIRVGHWEPPLWNTRFRVDTNGEVYADGTLHNPAGDFAEMLPATKGLEPGDLLAVAADGTLTRSTQAYQASVVGVYSTKPAVVGGYEDGVDLSGMVPLAVVGVVPAKVTAANGPIHPGDLLVASSMPGHAMKAGPNPPIGTVVGKALESLQSGTGVIRILVTLQ